MTSRPNLIIFGVDTLRADHLSLYGYPRLTSPHLDALAKEGAVFLEHFSPSIPTTPGYASMFTGKDCFGTGVVALRHAGDLAPGTVTLAEVLKEQGYRSLCVGFENNPAVRGFDQYLQYESWHPDAETGRAPKAEALTRAVLPELERFAQGSTPFFLFMRHMDPHAPYLPPRPFDRLFYAGDEHDPQNHSLDPVYAFRPFADFFKSWFPPQVTDSHYIDAQYDGAIAYLDLNIAVLLQALRTLGLYDNSIIVVTSDHGESLFEHDCYYDHHGLYDTNLRVPLIVRYPTVVPAGFRDARPSQAKDVMPTLLDLMGVSSSTLAFDGASLVPRLDPEGPDPVASADLYLTEATWMRKHGWRTSEWKLIEALEPDFHFKPRLELYDLVHDPRETQNLAEERPDVVKRLTARMNAHIGRRERETGRPNPVAMATGWHGLARGPFVTSEDAYTTLHIGSIGAAQQIQDRDQKEESP